jgi:hypothetical protein
VSREGSTAASEQPVAIIVMTLLLPHSLIVRPRWGVPIVEGLLLIAVIIGDPGKIDRTSRPVRILSITLIALLVVTTLWCTTVLIIQLIQGGPATSSGGSLLAAGGIVWLSNCLAFGLLYWEFDSGGPAPRTSLRRTGVRSSSTTSTWASPPPPRSAQPTSRRCALGTRWP